MKKYKLILRFNGYTMNRKETLNRLSKAEEAGVPVTNYGGAISFLHKVTPLTPSLPHWKILKNE